MSISSRQADLLYILTDSGVEVTLGAVRTYGSVRLASEEESAENGSPALQVQLSTITIVTGKLPGLAGGVTLVAGGVSYRVHRVFPGGDSISTRIIAYPTTAPAADFWTQGAILLPWASRVAGAAAGEAFDLDTIIHNPVLALEAEAAAAGTNPRLNASVQDCATVDGTFADCGYDFAEIGEEGGMRALAIDRSEVERYIKLAPAVTGTDDPEYWCGAVVLDVTVPR